MLLRQRAAVYIDHLYCESSVVSIVYSRIFVVFTYRHTYLYSYVSMDQLPFVLTYFFLLFVCTQIAMSVKFVSSFHLCHIFLLATQFVASFELKIIVIIFFKTCCCRLFLLCSSAAMQLSHLLQILFITLFLINYIFNQQNTYL